MVDHRILALAQHLVTRVLTLALQIVTSACIDTEAIRILAGRAQ